MTDTDSNVSAELDIKERLRLHALWVEDPQQGQQLVMRGAVLSDVDLSGADMSGADLRDADLRYADLHDVNMSDADLTGTQF